PDWVTTLHMESERKEEGIHYCHVNDSAALVWIANLASLELHPLLCKAPNLDRPTTLVFDLDPGPPAGAMEAGRIALLLRDLLKRLKLESFVKTSGGKGIHMAVPLNTSVTFD